MSDLVWNIRRALGILLFFLFVLLLHINAKAAVDGQLQERIMGNNKGIQLDIAAKSAILMEKNTGVILYEKEMCSIQYPASITKIMTALVVLENTALDEMVTFSQDALFSIEPGSSILGGIEIGDKMSVLDCLYGLMLTSGNEIAYALAEHVGGNVDIFVKMMNEKSLEIGCLDTSFSNPHGLHDEDHYTSAYDMALIFQEALKNQFFCDVINTFRYQFPDTRYGETRIRLNHHKMLENQEYAYEGCLGGKTGYTAEAGNTLVTYAEHGELELICVVLGESSPEHYIDTQKLFDYGFGNYEVKKIGSMKEFTYVDEFMPDIEKNASQIVCKNPDAYLVKPKGVTDSDITREVSIKIDNIEIDYYFNNTKIGTGVYLFEDNQNDIKNLWLKQKSKNFIVINVKLLFIGVVIIIFFSVITMKCIKKTSHIKKRRKRIKKKQIGKMI